MGIEAIGSIGSAVGNVASAVGRGVSSVGRISVEASAPAAALSGVGKLSGFGLKLEGPLTTIVNEGSVNLADLKATVPLGEIRFNEPLSVPSVLAEAESILSQAQKPVINSIPLLSLREADEIGPKQSRLEYNPTQIAASPAPESVRDPRNDELVETRVVSAALPNILEFPKPEAVASPAVEPAAKTKNALDTEVEVQPKTGSRTQLAEEKEELIEESVVKESPKESLEEEEITEKRLHLEDEEASAQRRYEIREAIIKAKVEAERLGLKKITGWLVAKFLPAEHEGNRSQIIKKSGPDGSYQEMVEAIAGVGELESEDKAAVRFNEIVAEKKPIKYGREGTPVADYDVARVLKYRMVKSGPEAHTEAVKRENTLEDLGLAEVFPKAA